MKGEEKVEKRPSPSFRAILYGKILKREMLNKRRDETSDGDS